ncbi:hypothetical protein GIB67_017075 [Kingdonia uniflora]|uniref:Peptide N-acetyl-beta-D-glucosaminyl asparaginase amidase A N-terminal domain-containing protein n=1 Tax=Kingdonia uniflora TaxID=39325 RepID=A0A7J7ND21_9MAGN|nr:hypothetical protein GIB67_017075 [Kingdonia uniflora]
MSFPLITFSLLLLYILPFSLSSPNHYLKSLRTNASSENATEYFDITKPLSFFTLPPSCSLLVFQQDFANTYGLPPASADYSPPDDCPGPWTYIVLELNASCRGEQYDRVAGVWLDGVELLRTSTAEPTEDGVFWNVRKDVTRYSSLLLQDNQTLTVMLENIVNEEFTGIYHVNISFLYYTDTENQTTELTLNRKLRSLSEDTVDIKEGNLRYRGEVGTQSGLFEGKLGSIYDDPADLVIPISDNGDNGFWFRIQNESDVHSKGIQIPLNTYKAVLEIYVSFHGDDEFWYSNPPDSYIKLNNLTTGRGNGAFRQVYAMIDGILVGSVVPFPVIFTGGINPLFWEPIVAIGAFDLPSYDVDLTPFLGFLLDGSTHSFEIGVTDSISFWLVDANLHLWLDPNSASVTAKFVLYQAPPLSIKRKSKFKQLDGKFKIDVKQTTEFSGWVNSSAGNLTTCVTQEFKFKNKIKFKNGGQLKEVEQKIKVETEVKIESETGELLSREVFKSKYPLNIITSTLPGPGNNTYLVITDVSHAINVEALLATLPGAEYLSSLSNSQVSGGWMVIQDHSVLSGTATTNQTLRYKDEAGCYFRAVSASEGNILEDNLNITCALSFIS